MYSQQPHPASSNSAPISFKVSYLFLALALLLLAILIAPPPIFAAGISVNTFADTLVAGDGNCSLREAVLNANSDSDTTSGDCVAGSGADTINLQAGTYTLSIPANWNDPESGDLDISSELTIIGMGVENSTIDASGLNHRLFEINGIATISDVTVTGGSGVIKGGGFLVNDDAQLHVTNTHIHHNSATSLGGGIANLGGYVTFSETLLSDNSAAVAGGAAYNADSGQMDVLNSAVLNNQAGPHRRAYYKFGGGFKNYNNANLKIQNSTISGNQAADDGGGIYNHSAKVTLINVTMVANRAFSDGGAIDNFGTAEFVNSIIVGNTASAYGKDCRSWYGWPLNNLGNNLLNSSSSCPSSATDQTIDLADLFVTGLAPLGDYGGATPTYELLPTSPALDNGNGAYCPSDDQRGYSRPLGAGCDIGSYENANQSGPIYTVNTADDVDDGACDYDHCSLREAILAANAKAGKDTIVFDLDAMGSDLIAPTMSLPDITDPVTIDGSGFIEEEESAGTAVTIDGSNVDDEATDGFVLRAGDSDIFGLIITNFDGNGIAIYQLGNNNITNNQIKNNGENGVVVHESIGNTIRSNEIFENGALGIDLNADGVTNNDNGDGDAGANDSQNAPFIIRAVPSVSATNVEGSFNSTPNSTFTLDFYLNQTCDPAGFGEGQQLLGSSEIVTNANGNAQLGTELSQVLPSGSFLTATATNGDGSTSEFSECTIVSLGNDAWTRAYRLPLTQTGTVFTGFASQHIDQEGQSRWYKLRVEPNSNLVVTLTNLPGNYDLTVYKDIAIAFN